MAEDMFRFDKDGSIELDRHVTTLDTFTHDFTKVLSRFTKYSLVGGFLAIFLGRSRSTEDIDLYVPRLEKKDFILIYSALKKAGFWCLNAESADTIYDYLKSGIGVRFARQETAIPNMEVKFTRDALDEASIDDSFKGKVGGLEFVFSSPEINIAFKRYYLKSPKDMEDAKHIEEVFQGNLDKSKLGKYKRLIARLR
ncbi:MAG: hypothetical protein AABX47_06955 [Nanoarchaeota archaeon]